jgi:hypothetical protein
MLSGLVVQRRDAFHERIEHSKRRAVEEFGGCFYIDLHGQARPPPTARKVRTAR